MTEQTLFRLAMILQNQASSTLNKYVCKLTETVLSEYPEGLSIGDISDAIDTQFSLTFSTDEIKSSIEKKGKRNIFVVDGTYFLQKASRQKLLKEIPLSERLNTIIAKYIETYPSDIPAEKVSSLLLEYLYYCFNSNVNNLLSLFNVNGNEYIRAIIY